MQQSNYLVQSFKLGNGIHSKLESWLLLADYQQYGKSAMTSEHKSIIIFYGMTDGDRGKIGNLSEIFRKSF